MFGTRHEEYKHLNDGLPFVFHTEIKRTYFNRSKENNWHENLEIQICTEGSGAVLLDGEKFEFNKNDMIVVNSNVIHYTGTDTSLTYSCLIVSNDFYKSMGMDLQSITFSSIVKNTALSDMLLELKEIYLNQAVPFRIAKLNQIVLQLLIALAEHHIVKEVPRSSKIKNFETAKNAVSYIRKNYNKKITLDEIAKAVFCDKYALCREFKRLTGQTIFENLNNYRCIKAIDFLNNGYTVAATASLCGFDNLSFFTKTFKKYIGKLPSEYKK